MSKKSNRFGIFSIAKLLFYSYVNKISNLTYLIRLETKLAKESFLKIIIFSSLLGLILLTTWSSLLVLFYFILTIHAELSPITTLCIILFVNVVLCVSLLFYISRLKKRMQYPATRKHLALR